MQIDWRYILRTGFLAGFLTFFVAIIGMIETFTEREIIADVLTLGQLLIFVTPLVAGYISARRFGLDAPMVPVLLKSLLVGGVAAILPITLIFIPAVFPGVRNMFVNISPGLVEILTFGAGTVVGALILLAVFVVSALIGAGVTRLPDRVRGLLLLGAFWVIGVGMMSELLKQVLQQFEAYGLIGRDLIRFVLAGSAFRPIPAVILFVVVIGVALARPRVAPLLQQRFESSPPGTQRIARWVGWALIAVALLLLPWLVGRFLSDVLVTVGIYVLMALGLNIAIGQAGLLDLGYLTNFAVGAYLTAFLTTTGPIGFGATTGVAPFNFWWLLPIALVAAMVTGFTFALPVLRMRGDYLAIATLGFGEIIGKLLISDWLKPVIGGAQGILFIPKPVLFGIEFSDPQQLYYIVLIAAVLIILVSQRLTDSRTGRQWMALREDEDVAATMGINTTMTKVTAFTLSAAAGGLAGAIFASKVGTVFPNSFTVIVSINVLSAVIVGGMGSVPGVVLGAIILVGMPELLREFSEFRFLLYGALLVVMMLVRPEGFIPSQVVRRELQEEHPAMAD